MIAITPDLTLCRIHQNWSFSLMWCCETFIMIRRPTPVFTYTINYKNTLSYTYSCWSYCAMIRLMEQILHSKKTLGVLTLVLPTEHWYCTVGKICDQSKGVEWLKSCTGTQGLRRQHWRGKFVTKAKELNDWNPAPAHRASEDNIGRENLWPEQSSWMTEILHRRTGLEKTTLKRGCRGMRHSDFTAYCPICPRRCFFHNSINVMFWIFCVYIYMYDVYVLIHTEWHICFV